MQTKDYQFQINKVKDKLISKTDDFLPITGDKNILKFKNQ